MNLIKKKVASLFHADQGPSPVEYSVMVALLVAASLTIIAGTKQISHPYISRIPATTTR